MIVEILELTLWANSVMILLSGTLSAVDDLVQMRESWYRVTTVIIGLFLCMVTACTVCTSIIRALFLCYQEVIAGLAGSRSVALKSSLSFLDFRVVNRSISIKNTIFVNNV